MRILIRNVETNLYMDAGKWVKDVEKAHDFKFGAEAIRFAYHHGLENIEVIYAFEEPRYNISTGIMNPAPMAARA